MICATAECELRKQGRQTLNADGSAYFLPFTFYLLPCARQYQRYVVGLFVVADPVGDGGGYDFGDALERQMAIFAH